jgi:uncharacterized protein YndB with AHSA1/START domain
MTTFAIAPDQDSLVTDIYIAAPPERVFQAITDPRQLVQWWGQSDMYRTTEFTADLRDGGKWRSVGVGKDGKPFDVEGEYREIDPPHLLVYTWRSHWMNYAETLVRWELTGEGKGTHVRLQHSGFAGALEPLNAHGNGWVRVLRWAQAYIERNETVTSRDAATSAAS